MNTDSTSLHRSFTALRRRAQRPAQPVERCEMCSAVLASAHQHLLEPQSRRLVCSCDACSMLFPNQPNLKYRRIPRDARYLADFRLTDAQWDELSIPIDVAFLFFSSPENRVVALYPSPAGPTESLLDLAAWEQIVAANRPLQTMEPDVEALLVNRLASPTSETPAEFAYYLAPIDKCFHLVGLIRSHWSGMSGGPAVWTELQAFFVELKKKARCW
ncbi:DUF5947 family protein [Lignipirellula cremea]|uniref:Uncharacterized protein n=1 Tax=Lignipirellula cremea TaxID=2528010 RepID=A0A518E509_9BACT|nr:DUF5947 family protein [Lignipirellula cremea]QDU99169.1 hypothetical protein Pla8534_70810 [Lignipirellula cremea]